jgi:linoleoyl-CoA desaturase
VPCDTGFHREVKRRVETYFEKEGISTKASLRMHVKTAVLLFWFVGSYLALLFLATTWWHAMLLSSSLAAAMAGIAFAVQHDSNHGAYSRHAFVNRAFGITLDVMGASSYIWQWKHNVAHHTYTGLHGADSDIDVPFGRLSPAQPRRRKHRFQQFYLWALYAVYVAYWHLFEDFKQLTDGRIAGNRFPRPRGWRLVEVIAGKLVFFGWAFVLPMFFHRWWTVLVCYAAASAALSFILIVIFQVAHSVEEADHPVVPPGDTVPVPWAVHQVETTVDFAHGNRLLSWYVGGLNYQIEHHLFPRICHVHYPRIAPIVRAVCAEFGVRYTVRPTFPGALASHWRWLVRMGRANATVS